MGVGGALFEFSLEGAHWATGVGRTMESTHRKHIGESITSEAVTVTALTLVCVRK